VHRGASPSGDRAGVPSGLSPQAVSSEAAHPLREYCRLFSGRLCAYCGYTGKPTGGDA
jgi:hypothetical protein